MKQIKTGQSSEGIDHIDTTPKEGGFFDLPSPRKVCNHPDHSFPHYVRIPKGKGYTHICPGCGNRITIISPE